jgi:hypothetical protein
MRQSPTLAGRITQLAQMVDLPTDEAMLTFIDMVDAYFFDDECERDCDHDDDRDSTMGWCGDALVGNWAEERIERYRVRDRQGQSLYPKIASRRLRPAKVPIGFDGYERGKEQTLLINGQSVSWTRWA